MGSGKGWVAGATGLLLAVVGSLGSPAVAAPPAPVVTDGNFCGRVQQLLAGTTRLPDENVVHPDYPAYRASKTTVRPLTSHQYLMMDPAAPDQPWRVSCKIKTPDHLNAEYGPGTAADPGLGCRDVNRDTVRRVYAGFTPAERARLKLTPDRILLEPDEVTFMGSSYVGDYRFAWSDPEGRLHLLAKRLRVDWDNIWLSWAPDRLRGALYCHLIAPEYLRRLALGEATAPAGP